MSTAGRGMGPHPPRLPPYLEAMHHWDRSIIKIYDFTQWLVIPNTPGLYCGVSQWVLCQGSKRVPAAPPYSKIENLLSRGNGRRISGAVNGI